MKTKLTFIATVAALTIFATTSAFAGTCGECPNGKKGDKKEDKKETAFISLTL